MKLLFKKRLNQEDQGTAAIEFSLIAPVMILMLVGLFDISNFIYCKYKMNNTVQEISNIVTRGNVTKPQLDAMLQAARFAAQPFVFTDSGNVIVTSVAQTNTNLAVPPTVMWRDSWPGGSGGSRINPGALPGGLSLKLNQTYIFTEIFYTYKPVFPVFNLIAPATTQIYAVAVAVPRMGTMTTLPPN